MTTAWTADHARAIDPAAGSRLPLIGSVERGGLADGIVYWDMWPIQRQDGRIASLRGREIWMALTAPDRGDPALRHFEAKIRLLERTGSGWVDLGPALPDIERDYEREWAGSAVTDGERVTLHFTAAGTDARPGGYQQRLFATSATIGGEGLPAGWSEPCETVTADPALYQPADAHEGEAGKIKAFRDPAWFRDPADGAQYLVFTASLGRSASAFNGAVGIARRDGDRWALLPPIIAADGVNNELERAHVVFHEGRYYAFWATQGSTFAPGLEGAPNGLYGMVADSLFGEYRPLNGSGLVLANPALEPFQTYSWFVTGELVVSSFVDFHGLGGRALPGTGKEANRFFGGVPAPLLQLAIDGDRCTLAGLADR